MCDLSVMLCVILSLMSCSDVVYLVCVMLCVILHVMVWVCDVVCYGVCGV